MRLKNRKTDDGEDNIFWVTMTDLMTALVLVFITLFFYTYMTSSYQKIEQNMQQQQTTEILENTFNNNNIKATVGDSGLVKISDLELFEINSYELSKKGKEYLDKFTPVYFDSLFSNKYMAEHIEKIIVEGHTDSQTYKGKLSEDEQYMKNMELSLKRAYSVADYMTKTAYNKDYGKKLRKIILVEGASYANPVIVNGKEDYAKSRRVELKIVLKKK